ncbi:hypothetical protein B0533_13355 [Sedimentibacter sp. SX930]|nr:hypothetical protein B0533_13355 [Sedimentibacter sp. SX930]
MDAEIRDVFFAGATQRMSGLSSDEEALAGVARLVGCCAPTRTCSQEKGPQITAVLRRGEPRRRNAPPPVTGGHPNTKKAARKLQTAESFGRTDNYL